MRRATKRESRCARNDDLHVIDASRACALRLRHVHAGQDEASEIEEQDDRQDGRAARPEEADRDGKQRRPGNTGKFSKTEKKPKYFG